MVTGAQYFPTAPIPGAATHAENRRFPREDYTRAINGSLSAVPDPPTWPTPKGQSDFDEELSNNLPPWDPTLEYKPMEYRGLHVNHLGPFSVESAQHAVGSDSSTHPGSGRLSNGLVSEQRRDFSEADPRGPSEDVWVPIVRPPTGQATSCHSSGGIGAQVEVPPAHVPGRGQYGMYCIGERGEEPALGNGEMNRAQ